MSATYTQIGAAAGITHQAAKERCPGAVPPRDTASVDIETRFGRISYALEHRTWVWSTQAATDAHGESEAANAGAFLAANSTHQP
ncbi:hypothetical protein ACIRD6_29960 [Streptomyces sp. NPDC102473]|uniref:hypothetical protein n=1 Tax=Streptomyces sp. NPDC102473 TaxID=3366180 RepID=UPI0037FB632D